MTSGYHFAFLVGAGLVTAGIVTAAALLRPDRSGTGEAEENVDQKQGARRPAYAEAA